ncbi:Cell_division control protein 48 [Hexamita inflata]|uniref:Cell_division control protein 48 n=1 Tax=Hexamita inflata TaxID=28002 RepID=A0ABP1HHH2_9EUKA
MNQLNQVMAARNKSMPKQDVKQVEHDPAEITLKIGASVEIPRVAYPCIYIPSSVYEQMFSKIVLFEDNLFPVLPALIDKAYCAPFNLQNDFKYVKQITFRQQPLVKALKTVVLRFDAQLRKFTHLQSYLKNILTNSVMNKGQTFEVLVNGRQCKFTVVSEAGVVSAATEIEFEPLEKVIRPELKINLAGYCKNLKLMYLAILGYMGVEQEKLLELKEHYQLEYVPPNIKSVLLYGDPGQGKSNFFFSLNKQLQNYVKIQFMTNGYEQPEPDAQLIFIDEIDSYSEVHQQLIQQQMKQYVIIAATNRPESVKLNFTQRFEVFQGPEDKLEQITEFCIQNNIQLSSSQLLHLATLSKQYSPADIDLILNNSDLTTLFHSYPETLKQYQPSNLKQYSMASKEPALLRGHEQTVQLITNQINDRLYTQPVLFYGLPGSGKGQLIKYLAFKLNCSILTINASEICSPYVGQTEIALKTVFARAAKTKILFLDEIDVLFAKDKQSHNLRLFSVFQQLLDKSCCVVIGATNRPWVLQAGVVRRFQKRVFFGHLTQEDAIKLLEDEVGQILDFKIDIENNNNSPFDKNNVITHLTKKRTGAEISDLSHKVKMKAVAKGDKVNIDEFTEILKSVKSAINNEEIGRFEQFQKDNQ